MEIKFFVPEKTGKVALNIKELNTITGKEYQYASRGRYAIGQILKTFCNAGDVVMVPAYFCPTILDVKKILEVNFCYYDLDLEDINPSLESIKHILACTNEKIRAIIVPSFYGNPANLVEIERLCADKEIVMIDDAAQSFGARLEQRYVGTYGTAGLLAFSPGKATSGHMGSLFWSSKKVKYKVKRHFLYHKICYANYIKNRVCVYEGHAGFLYKLIGILFAYMDCYTNIENDAMEKFEEELLGGFLWDNINLIDKRQEIFNAFVDRLGNKRDFRIIQGVRGTSHPCKIVLHFEKEDVCEKYKEYLTKKKVAWFGGYKGLAGGDNTLRNTTKIINHVIELPVEINECHMNYIIETLNEFCE